MSELVAQGIITQEGLTSLLGAERYRVTLNRLELRLGEENIVSNQRLAQLKGIVAGKLVVDPTTTFVPRLSAGLAQTAGALVVQRDELTVAVVEDLPEVLDAVRRELGISDFDVWLMTVQQFSNAFRALYTKVDVREVRECVDIFEVFDEALERKASDISLSVSIPPALRINGRPEFMLRAPLDADWLKRQTQVIAGDVGMAALESKAAYDFAFSYGSVRFRINLGYDRFGITIIARTLSSDVPSMDALALPRAIRATIGFERGLVLVTGPTGSGKSTTLASLLNAIAHEQKRHLITLEDPIEYYLTSGTSVVHQRELGRDFFHFGDALRQALRQDPDVILVGELRDYETMSTAVTAAETGHLVFATLHTYDAASSIARLVAGFPASEQNQVRAQLAYVLQTIVSQTLLTRATGKGRVAAFEILVNNTAVRSNIRKPDGHNNIRQVIESSQKEGMCTMDMSLADLVLRGLVTEKEAEERARDLDDFRRRIAHG